MKLRIQESIRTIGQDAMTLHKSSLVLTSAVLFAVTAALLIAVGYSSFYGVSLEAESGQLSGCVATVNQSGASGTGTNRAIEFGTGSGCPSNPPPSGENTFTFASIPDTQNEIGFCGSYGAFTGRLDWLVANKNDLNLKYVWQVGDLNNWPGLISSCNNLTNMQRSSEGLKILEQAEIPYVLSVGNHDTPAVGPTGSACSDHNPSTCPGSSAGVEIRNVDPWDQYYPKSRFPGIRTLCDDFNTHRTRLMSAGAPAGMSSSNLNHPQWMSNHCASKNTTDNAYRTFTAGGLNWLVINYEFYPRQVVQEWMKIVLEGHPNHNAVFVTHMFLGGSGSSLSTGFEGYTSPQGSPQAVYNNVISQYPNVRFTFSGHTGVANCATYTGAHGNRIYSYMDNRRTTSPVPNHVRLLNINVAAGTATSTIYAPNINQTLSQASNCNVTNISWVQ